MKAIQRELRIGQEATKKQCFEIEHIACQIAVTLCDREPCVQRHTKAASFGKAQRVAQTPLALITTAPNDLTNVSISASLFRARKMPQLQMIKRAIASNVLPQTMGKRKEQNNSKHSFSSREHSNGNECGFPFFTPTG